MIHHRGTEGTEEADVAISGQIVGAAIEVHRRLGPGLLESSYQICLARELTFRGVRWEQQRQVPLVYRGVQIQNAYRIDFLVEERVVLEIKAIEMLQPIHRAQLLTYLKILDLRVGLLINFNVETLVRGIRRVVNGY
jgi:GxxExxY protein